MSYNPTQWSAGDTVTSAKLNKIEQGISDNGVLEINLVFDEETGNPPHLDKTWQEIYNANNSVVIIQSDSEEYPTRTKIIDIGFNEDSFIVRFFGDSVAPVQFLAASPDDYPVMNMKTGGNTHPVA